MSVAGVDACCCRARPLSLHVCVPWGVSDNRIGGAGAAAIAEALALNTSIMSLNLAGECRAGARLCGHFYMPRWAYYYWVQTSGDNGIGCAGAAAIAEALKVNTTITSVQMWRE